MVIFHSYVSLPEGIPHVQKYHIKRVLSHWFPLYLYVRPAPFPEALCRGINAAADSAAGEVNEPSFLFCQRMLTQANLRKEWMHKASNFLQFAIADLHLFDRQCSEFADVTLVTDHS